MHIKRGILRLASTRNRSLLSVNEDFEGEAQRRNHLYRCILQKKQQNVYVLLLSSVGITGFEPVTPNSRSWCANRTALHPEDYVCVGIPGFEPGTPCSQSRCANRTALHPETYYPFGFVGQRYTLFSSSQSFCSIFWQTIPSYYFEGVIITSATIGVWSDSMGALSTLCSTTSAVAPPPV